METTLYFIETAGTISWTDRGLFNGYREVYERSRHGKADFPINQLAPYFGINVNDTEYRNGIGDGSFYRFVGQTSIHNLADAGSFLWGLWMRTNCYTYVETVVGSQLHKY